MHDGQLCGRFLLGFTVLVLVQTTGVHAQITSASTGGDMVGGFVTVTHFGGAMSTAPIVASGTGCTATSPGDFIFSIPAGDTFAVDWKLENIATGPTARAIGDVRFDLTLSNALFDNDSLPSTPDSFAGVLGGASITGPGFSPGGEANLWPGAGNLGDMYRGQVLGFTSFLIPGASMTWHDDTDLVPEPATLTLLAAGGFLALSRRRFS